MRKNPQHRLDIVMGYLEETVKKLSN